MAEPKETYRWFTYTVNPHQTIIYEFKTDQKTPDPERGAILSVDETTLLQHILHETATRLPDAMYGPSTDAILAGFYQHHQRKTAPSQPPLTEATAK